MPDPRKIRVLIVDDSAIVRKILSEALAEAPDIEIVGAAPDPYVARDKILALDPDVITLDIEMPRMDGLTFLKKLMHFHPIPTLIISSLTQPSCRAAIEALEFGAVEVLAKPGGPYSVGELRNTLAAKIRAAAAARVRPHHPADSATRDVARIRQLPGSNGSAFSAIVAIGASTGGTDAIATIMARLPADCPAILIAQHIPPEFSRAFANRLNEQCAMQVKEAVDGDVIRPGLALVAPGDFHMLLRPSAGGLVAHVKGGPRVCYQRPSVEVLFHSVAEVARERAVGVLLTGMGTDGAQGLLRMRQAKARTIAQDEATSAVFGMPREAIAIGAAEAVLPLEGIAPAILALASRLGSQTSRIPGS